MGTLLSNRLLVATTRGTESRAGLQSRSAAGTLSGGSSLTEDRPQLLIEQPAQAGANPQANNRTGGAATGIADRFGDLVAGVAVNTTEQADTSRGVQPLLDLVR